MNINENGNVGRFEYDERKTPNSKNHLGIKKSTSDIQKKSPKLTSDLAKNILSSESMERKPTKQFLSVESASTGNDLNEESILTIKITNWKNNEIKKDPTNKENIIASAEEFITTLRDKEDLLDLSDRKLKSLPNIFGATATRDLLVEINLGGNNLSELPPELYTLPNLRWLKISGNPEELEINVPQELKNKKPMTLIKD